MTFSVIIPARYASERLPGKPLVDIAGKSMIQHVYERAQQSDAAKVIVATDDTRVAEVVSGFGGEVCMTSSEHPSGTDRLQEVVQKYGLAQTEIVVNVQGDEPLIPAAVINQVAANLQANDDASAATLCEPVHSYEEVMNPNAVKVVVDEKKFALYFSRAAIPWHRDSYTAGNIVDGEVNSLARRHIGIYAYRVELLNQFVKWSPSALEKIEKLEQLRILSNGLNIHVEDACDKVPGGVDTLADLENVRAIISAK